MEIKYIVVHCSATPGQMDIGAKEIDKWHRDRKWKGIGYHFVIRRNGLVELGRPLGNPGAHTSGYNTVSWGICMVGGLDDNRNPEDNFTKEQYDSLEDLLRGLHRIATDSEIVGHRDLSPDANNDGIIQKWEWVKDCPCFEVSEYLEDRGILCEKKEKAKPFWKW